MNYTPIQLDPVSRQKPNSKSFPLRKFVISGMILTLLVSLLLWIQFGEAIETDRVRFATYRSGELLKDVGWMRSRVESINEFRTRFNAELLTLQNRKAGLLLDRSTLRSRDEVGRLEQEIEKLNEQIGLLEMNRERKITEEEDHLSQDILEAIEGAAARIMKKHKGDCLIDLDSIERIQDLMIGYESLLEQPDLTGELSSLLNKL